MTSNVTLLKTDLFLTNAPIKYSLKTPENQKFSGVFSDYDMVTLARNGKILISQ